MEQSNKLAMIGVIFGALSVLTGSLGLIPLTKSKSLSYEIRSETSFSPISDFGEFGVDFGGRRLTSPKLTVLRITNSGNMPINLSDYDGPLKVAFPRGTLVEGVKIAKTTPSGIPVRAQKNGQEVDIEPLLLNPNDSFDLSVLASRAPDLTPSPDNESSMELQVVARISDLTDVSIKTTTSKAKNSGHPVLHYIFLTLTYASGSILLALQRKNRLISTRKLMPEGIVLFASSTAAVLTAGPLNMEFSGAGKATFFVASMALGAFVSVRAYRILQSGEANTASSWRGLDGVEPFKHS